MVNIYLDRSREGIPGKIRNTEWSSWKSKDGNTTMEGLVIHIEDWEFPIRYSAAKTTERGINPVSNLGAFLNKLTELGIKAEEKNFDTTQLHGKTFVWNRIEVGGGDFLRKIQLPTAILETAEMTGIEIEKEEVKAETTEELTNTLKEILKEKALTDSQILNELIKLDKKHLIVPFTEKKEELVNNKILTVKANKYAIA